MMRSLRWHRLVPALFCLCSVAIVSWSQEDDVRALLADDELQINAAVNGESSDQLGAGKDQPPALVVADVGDDDLEALLGGALAGDDDTKKDAAQGNDEQEPVKVEDAGADALDALLTTKPPQPVAAAAATNAQPVAPAEQPAEAAPAKKPATVPEAGPNDLESLLLGGDDAQPAAPAEQPAEAAPAKKPVAVPEAGPNDLESLLLGGGDQPQPAAPAEQPAEAPAEEPAAVPELDPNNLESMLLGGGDQPQPEPKPVEQPPAPVPDEAAPAGAEPTQAVGAAAEPGQAGEVVDDNLDKEVESAMQEAIAAGIPELDPRLIEISNLMLQEEQMRKAQEAHAKEKLLEAEQALLLRNYPDAIKLFDDSIKNYGHRPETAEMRARAQAGLMRALYQRALVLQAMRDKDSLKDAREQAVRAAALGHPRAAALVAEIDDWLLSGVPKVVPPPPKDILNNKDFIKAEREIKDLLLQGRQNFAAGRYNDSLELFERVLKRDPYNTEAIRWRHKVAQRQEDLARHEREGTRTDMMRDVIQSWNPRDYGINEVDKGIEVHTAISKDTDARRVILEKMENIEIPEVNFHLANIHDVIDQLVEESKLHDQMAKPGEKKGVDIVLKLSSLAQPAGGQQGQGGQPAGGGGDLFGGGDAGGGGDLFGGGNAGGGFGGGGGDLFGGGNAGGAAAEPAAQASGVVPITFRARKISLLECLKLVTKIAGLSYRVEGSVIMVVSPDEPVGEIITRMYNVLPNVNDKIRATQEEMQAAGGGQQQNAGLQGGAFMPIAGAGQVNSQRENWKTFFEQFGVPWPEGSSIAHLPSIGKIVVANTADNLTIFEKVLNELNVVPSQIEIEARFVEVRQTDMNSLGIEWLLTDNWEIAQKKGVSGAMPAASVPQVRIPANSADGGFTKGLRYLNSFSTTSQGVSVGGGVSDDILRISSILTNPEMSFVLHALIQQGHADVLSAPKVTAASGSEATIKVVTEYIYPTDFTVQPIMGTDANGTSTVVGGIVEPSSFETREVGVILSVLPEVSPDGQLIKLTMTPEVVTDPTWKNYGSEYSRQNADGTTDTQQLPMEQPFFHTRSVSTSISVYNGATVVMGGMITEQRDDVDDSIPILGSIPIIGRLFRSSYERSEKRNLLIFVTARLIDPAGKFLKDSRVELPFDAGTSPEDLNE